MNRKTKTYKAIDFARYHEGNMDAKEMHILEKAALEDPFLADALEGYIHTNSATEDVQHLKSMLADKTKSKKVYTIASVSQNVWWRIAAIFILIGIAGYFIFNKGMEHGRTMAKNETDHLNQKVEQLPAYDSQATAMAVEKEQKHAIAPASTKMEKSIQKPEQPQRKAVPQKKETTSKQQEQFAKNSPSPRRSSLSLQKKLEDTTLIAGNYARIMDNRKGLQEKMVTSKLRTSDSGKTAMPALLGSDTPLMALQSTADQSRSTNRKNAELSELKVLEEAKKNNLSRKVASNVFNAKPGDVVIVIHSKLELIEGTENFKVYISNNKQNILDSNGNVLHGIVQLEFSINKKGQPIKINVLKSECPPCENHAISLLENGPLWKGDLDKKGEVTIIF